MRKKGVKLTLTMQNSAFWFCFSFCCSNLCRDKAKDNRILWVKGQSCHTNDTIPNYSPTGRLDSWTLLFGAREVIYAVGNILSQEHYFTWETRNYDSVLRTYLRKKHLVTRALFHRGEGNLSICISRVAVWNRSRSLSPNGPSYL